MGMSSSAFLVWGIDLGRSDDRDLPLPWEETDAGAFDEVFAKALGVEAPNVEYSETAKALHSDYWDRKHKAIKASGVNLFGYGHREYQGAVLGVTASLTKSIEYGCEALPDGASFVVDPAWRQQLLVARMLLGIQGEPKWLLASAYG